MKVKTPKSQPPKLSQEELLFQAEGAYAESMVRAALGDNRGAVAALEQSLEAMPTYAPAILGMGSVEYQRGRIAKGRKLFQSLLSLPKNTKDICQIIDEAGLFLTRIEAWEDSLELYRAAVERFPAAAGLVQGIGYCAGHLGFHDEAILASERALELEPENQLFVNDLGWSLLEAGRLPEAKETLERAVAMNPTDELARENLRFCKQKIASARRKSGKAGKSQAARRGPRSLP